MIVAAHNGVLFVLATGVWSFTLLNLTHARLGVLGAVGNAGQDQGRMYYMYYMYYHTIMSIILIILFWQDD